MTQAQAWYREQLKDPRWQALRLLVLERDGWRCTACKKSSKSLQVHHTKYIQGKPPFESPIEDLISLCKKCHRRQHRRPSTRPFIPSDLDDSGLSASEFRVYCHLARRDPAWASIATMSDTCRLHKKTVAAVLRTLVDRGMITKVIRPGWTNLYRLTAK